MNSVYDEFSISITANNNLKFELATKRLYHPLDGGLAFGNGYRLIKGQVINIGIQYYLGLVDVKIDDNTPDQKNGPGTSM